MTAVLELSELSAGYGPMQVVHDVNLAIAPGTRVGLVGLNGHGKTTLLRSVVGLVDWMRGRIELRGRPIGGLAPHRIARKGLILIPQGDSLFPGLPVRDNLDSGAYLSKSWGRRAERRRWRVSTASPPRSRRSV